MKTAFSGFISTLYTVKEKISELTGKSIKLLNLKYKEKKDKNSQAKRKKKKAQHLRSNGQFQNMQHMFYWKTRRTKEKQSQRNI